MGLAKTYQHSLGQQQISVRAQHCALETLVPGHLGVVLGVGEGSKKQSVPEQSVSGPIKISPKVI